MVLLQVHLLFTLIRFAVQKISNDRKVWSRVTLTTQKLIIFSTTACPKVFDCSYTKTICEQEKCLLIKEWHVILCMEHVAKQEGFRYTLFFAHRPNCFLDFHLKVIKIGQFGHLAMNSQSANFFFNCIKKRKGTALLEELRLLSWDSFQK